MDELALPDVAGVRHHFVDVDGVRLHVAEAGSGPPLLCLHGWPQHWWTWRHLLAELAPDYRVICPDLRGYGWSSIPETGYDKQQMATDVLALLDALGLDRVGLIGHDWGGVIGFLLCLRAPDRFERYLALNTGHPFVRPSLPRLATLWRFNYQVAQALPVLGPLLARRLVPEAFARIGAGDAWSPSTRETYLAPLRQPARARAATLTYRTFLTREILPILAGRYRGQRLRVPTLFVHGDADLCLSPAFVAGGERHADDFRLELVPGAGHFITDEAPDLVLDRARQWFANREPDAHQ